MEVEVTDSMADQERRALLTDAERDILTGEKDVSEKYYYVTVTRVRRKIERLAEEDLEAIEHHDTLADELRELICSHSEVDQS